MKLTLLALLIPAVIVFAADLPNAGAPPKTPALTDTQKLAIATALYDNEALNQAREAIGKAEAALRTQLAACGSGFAVSRDPATREFKCVAVSAPPSPAK